MSMFVVAIDLVKHRQYQRNFCRGGIAAHVPGATRMGDVQADSQFAQPWLSGEFEIAVDR